MLPAEAQLSSALLCQNDSHPFSFRSTSFLYRFILPRTCLRWNIPSRALFLSAFRLVLFSKEHVFGATFIPVHNLNRHFMMFYSLKNMSLVQYFFMCTNFTIFLRCILSWTGFRFQCIIFARFLSLHIHPGLNRTFIYFLFYGLFPEHNMSCNIFPQKRVFALNIMLE